MRPASIELLVFDGCPHGEALAPRLRKLVGDDATVVVQRVESEDEARRLRFLGSPSVRVDGRDIEPGAEAREDFGLKCRLYRVDGMLSGAPPDAWIRRALEHHGTRAE
jgi:hypothetical protein